MANYPVIPQSRDSSKKLYDVVKVSVASNGTVRAKTESTTDTFSFDIIHSMISTADKDAILAHHSTDKNGAFTFDYDGDGSSYSCVYLGRPVERWAGAGVWDMSVSMVGS
jgi:hypothetical protein